MVPCAPTSLARRRLPLLIRGLGQRADKGREPRWTPLRRVEILLATAVLTQAKATTAVPQFAHIVRHGSADLTFVSPVPRLKDRHWPKWITHDLAEQVGLHCPRLFVEHLTILTPD